MHPYLNRLQSVTRRHFLQSASLGLGSLALAELGGAARADVVYPHDNPLAPRKPHFAGTAKRVIYLHMSGAPPHLDLLDYKPQLQKHDGENCPDEYLKGKRFAFTSGVPKLLGTRQPFKPRGKSGIWMSDAIKPLHDVADDVTVIRSMKT